MLRDIAGTRYPFVMLDLSGLTVVLGKATAAQLPLLVLPSRVLIGPS